MYKYLVYVYEDSVKKNVVWNIFEILYNVWIFCFVCK